MALSINGAHQRASLLPGDTPVTGIVASDTARSARP
ncbi:hypothetical protein M2167_001108 [Streptomyces sp. SPB4]|nr:hypothetical protein [Streptomyces sp. SPB4]